MNNENLIKNLIERIKSLQIKNFRVMEVCGTHTQAISKLGIRELVSPGITLLSGPGCPVCVTSESYIDTAIYLSNQYNVIIATFGDLLKVNGSSENLTMQREKGKRIHIVYSPLDIFEIAEKNKDSEIVFLGVGFETTAPLIALAIKTAEQRGIHNVSFLTCLKRMEPILHNILKDKEHKIDGIMCPGHVAAVKGSEYFRFITDEYNIPSVVTGFEALDILGGLYFLVEQNRRSNKQFKNLYKRCVTPEGNMLANRTVEEIFSFSDCEWRGIGKIEDSGLCIKDEYSAYDALSKFELELKGDEDPGSCVCGEILLGKKAPGACRFFGDKCSPEHPLGPCMVSSEGACSIFYRYNRRTYYE